MTDKEINEAIAEALGWKIPAGVVNYMIHPSGKKVFFNPMMEPAPLPDYCNDLNAMHEAEEQLCGQFIDDCEAIDVYQSNLSMILGGKFWKYCHAYARDRARAFLMTIGKWREA